jgi:hypothetical protein
LHVRSVGCVNAARDGAVVARRLLAAENEGCAGLDEEADAGLAGVGRYGLDRK